MSLDTYAIVKGGLVINIIEYDAQPESPPPGFDEGVVAIKADGVSIGWTYKNGIFTPPQPYPSWKLVNNEWVPPVPFPDDGQMHKWNESTQSWD